MKKEIIHYARIFTLLIAVFFSYSVLVCLLPTQTIRENIVKSAVDMEKEKTVYPSAIIRTKACQMDNFTDGIFLKQNYAINNKKPVQSAMEAGQARIKFADLPHYKGTPEELGSAPYPRYWHGNSFILRPFLLIATYTEIRWILYAVSSLLMFILAVRLQQTLGMKRMIAFMAGLLYINIFVTQFSMQFFTVSALALIASIYVCSQHNDRRKILRMSFIIGCLTSYFDLLTAPFLTCGLPLLVYLCSTDNNGTFKTRLQTLFLFVVLWGAGYGLTWASKWVLGTILTDVNVFESAFNQVNYHASNKYGSRILVISQNFDLLPNGFLYTPLIALLLLAIVFFNKKAIQTNVLLFIAALSPYVWFLLTAQHSYRHWWFTYRIQAIAVSAVFLILVNFISWDKLTKKNLLAHWRSNISEKSRKIPFYRRYVRAKKTEK